MLLIVPLGLDTFAVSAAVGLRRPTKAERRRVMAVLVGFEAAMPLAGLAVGRAAHGPLGAVAHDLAAVLLCGLGVWMLFSGGEDDAGALVARRGVGLVTLGLAVSLDELAVGIAAGLLHRSIWLAAALIGCQAFVACHAGLAVGARVGEAVREGAERVAGVVLIALGVLVVAT